MPSIVAPVFMLSTIEPGIAGSTAVVDRLVEHPERRGQIGGRGLLGAPGHGRGRDRVTLDADVEGLQRREAFRDGRVDLAPRGTAPDGRLGLEPVAEQAVDGVVPARLARRSAIVRWA